MTEFNLVKYAPTIRVLIDDSLNYLRSLSTLLPLENNLYKYFNDPREALSWINGLADDDMRTTCSPIDKDRNCNHIDFDLSRLHQAIYSEKRFNKVSTIVVDYDMPGMTGLEFCRDIKNPYIKKILLTGHLDDRDARDARNNGWVDVFLTKGEDNAEKLTSVILDAEAKFNDESNALFKAVLEGHSGNNVCKSEPVKEFLKSIYEQHNAVEYYALNLDGDYIFIDAQGNTCGVSIQDKARRNEYLELASDLNDLSDEIIINSLKNSSIFCSGDENELPAPHKWADHIHPAIVVDQERDLMGAYGANIFAEKAKSIKPFKPVYDLYIDEAIKALKP